MKDILITQPTKADVESAYMVFEISIRDAFEREGLGHLEEGIRGEIIHKQHMIDIAMNISDSGISFMVAKLNDIVIGTISFGPCGEDIRKCTNNLLDNIGELGSLYILPQYQGRGIGSALINTMISHVHEQGIEEFCLDSGYKNAQKRWLRKFGKPYKIVKDYWGLGSDHMIWLCKTKDFIGNRMNN